MIHPVTEELVDFLNSMIEIDKKAINDLFEFRTRCNDDMAKDLTVQINRDDSNNTVVGMLGIINGFCGIFTSGPLQGHGPITANYDDDNNLIQFSLAEND